MTGIKEILFTFIRNDGGAAIFLCLLLEYAGLPIPGETLMLLLGFLSAGKGILTSVILAVGGTFAGSMLAYAVGYRWGEPIVLKLGKPLHLTKEKLDLANGLLRKHGALAIVFGRFIPGVRHVMPYMSGIAKVDAGRNALYNLVSGAVWCSVFLLLGSVAGSDWTVISRAVGVYTLAALALILYIFLVFRFCRGFRIPVLLLSASLMSFMLLTSELLEKELSPFDSYFYGRLSGLITEDRTGLMRLTSNMGSPYVLIAGTAVFLTVLWRRKKDLFFGKMMVVNLAGASLLNLLFKTVFHRARPDILPLVQASGYSYPSGHSMVSAAFYGYLIYLCAVHFKRPWKQIVPAGLSLLILAIGISRIYLGVHYASDVIGGFLAGFSWLIILTAWTKLHRDRQKPKTYPMVE